MKLFLIITFFSSTLSLRAQDALPPIGQWREHLPYKSAIDVCAGDGKVYAATPYSLFSVTTADNSIERYSRITGLSETGISTVQYDQPNHKLLVAYENSNFDIIYKNEIHNVPDIKRDNIIGDKTILNIYVSGSTYYLSTGLGIILIDANRYEIKDSWFIGNGGNQVRVTGCATDGNFFYAATAEGLKRAAVSSGNLADHRNWSIVSGSGLSAGACRNVFFVEGKMVTEKNDSLFVLNGNNWDLLYTDGWSFTSSNLSNNKLLVCERNAVNAARVLVLNPDGTISRRLENNSAVSFPRKTILYNGEPWLADQYTCLTRFTSSSFQTYSLNSPQNTAGGEIVSDSKSFYATSGAVNSSWNYQYNGDGVYILNEGSWNNINRYSYNMLDSMLDMISIAVDKTDRSFWVGSFGGGLLHVSPGPVFRIFKQGKLEAPAGDPLSYRVSGLTFDTENNLWISNFGAAHPLKVMKKDGTWKEFSVPFPLFENAMSQILIDDNGYKWIVCPLGNGLICFDDAGTIDNTGDDRWRKLGAATAQGNLPGTEVYCLAKDKSGYLWIGTNDGVAVIQCPEQTFSGSGCNAIWPIVPNGNFAGYLFKGQEVRTIAVDGADRKWVATNNGAFLVSNTGERVIYRFTEDNSPLLSSDVRKIAIDGSTGEVFFETQKGICSFRSTATEATASSENVLVFPNPVPPGFSGTIAIKGLPENAMVKITEADGRLVYQTRALGGQAVWDGRNYRGQRIASGAYMVLVSDKSNKEHVATKIFFIAR